MNQSGKRDSWASRAGFVLACIGSAVGMGNIWLFPSRVSAYGGATFLIPYLIFVALIGSTGVIGEMAFGRATRSGPIHAFGQATKRRCGSERSGRALGFIPVLGSLAMAIGYSVVVGWIFNYLAASFTGGLSALSDVGAFSARFDATAAGNAPWQIAGMLITLVIMALGVGGGIEKANKVMMPLFFALFLGLAVYLAFLPGSAAGYRYIFILDPKGLADPMVWVYALGQAFFSLSIAGNGTLIYGSYLSEDSDIPADARLVAVFDTLAALVAALVIIPAMALAGQELTQSGPGLMFIFLPNVLRGIPGGGIILMVFFTAVTFAALTSLINPLGAVGIGVGLAISPIVSQWMDVCSIYICPLGALLAAVMFFWVWGKDDALAQVNQARKKPLGRWFYPLAKYLFCGVTLLVLVLGAVMGGIG